jgi:hypothetical protein
MNSPEDHSRPTVVVLAIVASITGLVFGASKALGASNAPLSGAWNIASSGEAGASGELVFRVTRNDGSDPVEVTVAVSSGTNEAGVARNIRRSLASQLRADQFNVALGEGSNVLVTDQRGEPNFTIELLDSDVENLRVMVQSVQPVAPPTVPEQRAPANPPQTTPATPAEPGNATPPANPPQTPAGSPPAPVTSPTPSPSPSTPVDQPAQSPAPSSPAPSAPGSSGAGAATPPPG